MKREYPQEQDIVTQVLEMRHYLMLVKDITIQHLEILQG